MSDICERLVRFNQHKECVSTDLEVEAAAEITRLREENARLREVLKPFAKMADELDDEWEDDGMHWIDCHQFEHVPMVGDLRAARAAIREGGND